MPKFVKDIMNKSPKTVTEADPLYRAASLLCKYEISCLPVVDGEKQVIGWLHANDLLRAISEQKSPNTPINQLMKEAPVVLSENTSIAEATTQLTRAKVKGAPVANSSGEITGFFHVRDIEEKVPNSKSNVDQICNACKHQQKKAA